MATARRRRPRMKTKEELIAYLEQNPHTELPFNPEVWEKAVEHTKDKERTFRTITTTEPDGTTTTKKIPNGALNPVSKYFQLIALPQYQVPYEPEQDTDEAEEDTEWDDEEDDGGVLNLIGDEEQQTVNDLVKVFFAGYTKADKKWVTNRLAEYYSNYSLNEGADKMLVVKAVSDELEIMKLTQKRARGSDVSKKLKDVQSDYLDLLESLKALKKQRSKLDEQGSNKFTIFMDELEREGEFKPPKIEYRDDLDKMLDLFVESIRRTLHEG